LAAVARARRCCARVTARCRVVRAGIETESYDIGQRRGAGTREIDAAPAFRQRVPQHADQARRARALAIVPRGVEALVFPAGRDLEFTRDRFA
jgi:hypothetical protein